MDTNKTPSAAVQLQQLMNSVSSGGGAIVEINGRKVRCLGVPIGNTTKMSYRFDLDGKRSSFAKVCAALGAWGL